MRDAMAIPEEAVTVMASLDGVLAPMKDGDAVGKHTHAAARSRMGTARRNLPRRITLLNDVVSIQSRRR